jgi:AAHS family 4-hydroxybenzoate transporter-like MFS transporter
MVVNKYPPERIASTLRRVVGGDNFSAATTFTVSEQKVETKAKAKALLSADFRGITVSLWATYFMGLLVIYLLSGWLPTLIKEAGLPIERAANITAMFQLGGTVGALVVGYLMDKLDPEQGDRLQLHRRRLLHPAAGVGQRAVLAVLGVRAAGRFLHERRPDRPERLRAVLLPDRVRATGVSWMQGIGRFGSIFGSFAGGVLLSMGWGFSAVSRSSPSRPPSRRSRSCSRALRRARRQ